MKVAVPIPDHIFAEAEYTEYLRHAWKEGTESGDAGILDFAELKQAARREIAATKE